MARPPRHDTDIPPAIERHMRDLGFNLPRLYLDWCWANGFSQGYDKSKSDLIEERDLFGALAKKKLAQNRLHKNPKAFLEAVCLGDLTSDEIDRPNFKLAAAEIEESNESPDVRASLLEMLTVLIRQKDLIFEGTSARTSVPFIRGLIKLHDRKALWLRPLEGWKPKSKNSLKKFGELTHYLFDQYHDVPRFMESVWLRGDRPSWRYRDWYIHLGRGHNLRKAKSPIPITKKMAHHFMAAPDDFTVEQAMRWSQMKALGAPENAIHAVAATRMARSFEHEDFWFSVLRFITANPMLDPRQIGPMVDYLQNQKYEAVQVQADNGEWEDHPPAQPGLSMSGRTVTTLMQHVDAWHESLGRLKGLPDTAYDAPDFGGFVVEKRNGQKTQRWRIHQLRSAKELTLESEALRHCVSSYHWSCAKGHCTIWSLSVSADNGVYERRQTIEVSKNNEITQCRGLANCDPSNEEWGIVNTWAGKENLAVASYL
ncbi:MAG: PcfJ domain-containing protein [Maricaulaceae bacterium]